MFVLRGYTLLSCRYDADELPRCSSEEARGDPSQLYDVVSQIALLMTEMVANDGVDKLSTPSLPIPGHRNTTHSFTELGDSHILRQETRVCVFFPQQKC